MTADQLMECPFCGGKELGIGRSTEDREGFPTYIYCAECGAHGPYVYTRKPGMWTCTELAAQETGWNTRPTAVASHAEGEVVAWQYRMVLASGRASNWQTASKELFDYYVSHPTFDDTKIETRELFTHPPRSGDEVIKAVRELANTFRRVEPNIIEKQAVVYRYAADQIDKAIDAAMAAGGDDK